MAKEGDVGLAMSHLEAQCQVNGVASVRVRDGEIFMFSRGAVESLLEKMAESKQDRIVVFVRAGGVLSKETAA